MARTRLKDKINLKINGDTPEEKFKHLETIIARLYRRIHKTIIGVMPYVPIMFYVEQPNELGLLGRYIVPGKCGFKSVEFYVGEMPHEVQPTFLISIKRGAMTHSAVISLEEPIPAELQIELMAGDVIEISTTQAEMREISFTALLDFGDKLTTTRKKFLITELEENLPDEGI